MTHTPSRRDVLRAGGSLAAVSIFSAAAGAVSPNGKLRTAHVGVGGMGGGDLAAVASHAKIEVAALCDVDATTLERARARYPHAKVFRDYRELFATFGDSIDAVVVSTPDHTHAPAAMSALQRRKPVYCQKPLTHDVYEARQLRIAANRAGAPTQMGIHVHSSAVYRRAVRMVQNGVIGKVRHVHAWSAKNWGYDGGPMKGDQPPPKNLDWNLWIGTAGMRPFVSGAYHPENWRKLIDFGTGTLGDMGVHIFDTPFAALELTYPKSVKTTCRAPTGIGHPEKNIVTYEFPGTKHTTESLTWTWYDGADAPPKPGRLELPPDVKLPGQGSLFVGQEGFLLLPHVGEAQLFPEPKFRDYKRPAVEEINHYHQWVNACLGDGKTSTGFDYSGPLTEALLLGVVANRFPEQKLAWNAEKLEFADHPAANKLLRRVYREGFEVRDL